MLDLVFAITLILKLPVILTRTSQTLSAPLHTHTHAHAHTQGLMFKAQIKDLSFYLILSRTDIIHAIKEVQLKPFCSVKLELLPSLSNY